MKITLPQTIESGHGDKIIFKEIFKEKDGDKFKMEGYWKPNGVASMRVHYIQDEALTGDTNITTGKIAFCPALADHYASCFGVHLT